MFFFFFSKIRKIKNNKSNEKRTDNNKNSYINNPNYFKYWSYKKKVFKIFLIVSNIKFLNYGDFFTLLITSEKDRVEIFFFFLQYRDKKFTFWHFLLGRLKYISYLIFFSFSKFNSITVRAQVKTCFDFKRPQGAKPPFLV